MSSFQDEMKSFQDVRQNRRFYSDQDRTVSDQQVGETILGAGEASMKADMRRLQEYKPPKVKQQARQAELGELETEDRQRDFQNQIKMQQRRGQIRTDQAARENLQTLAKRAKALAENQNLTATQRSAEERSIEAARQQVVSQKYTMEDVVKEGRVYDPSQFAQRDILDPETGERLGVARINRKHYAENNMVLPDFVTREQIKEMGMNSEEGEVLMFDEQATPSSVFNYLNRNGDGTKLAEYARFLDEVDILYERDMDPSERVAAYFGYMKDTFLNATQNGALSVASAADDMVAGIQGLFYDDDFATGFSSATGSYANRINYQNYMANPRPVLTNDFFTDVSAAVMDSLPGLAATFAVAAITKNPMATMNTATATLGQLGGRAVLNGTRGLFANQMNFLVKKLDNEKAYLAQGMSADDARLNSYMDMGAGVLFALPASTKLLAGANSFLMKNPTFRSAYLAAARHKVPHIIATGFTREAIQEGMEEAMQTALTAAMDRADLFGEREDGDWLIGARELLMAMSAGGVIGGTVGAGVDLFGVVNAIDAEFQRGNKPKVGQPALAPDGSPIITVDTDKFFIHGTDVEVDPDAVDPEDEQGRTYAESRMLRQGRPGKVTEANQKKIEREWKKRFYQKMVMNSMDESNATDRIGTLRNVFDRLRAFSEGKNKAFDPEIFGDPTQEIYEGDGPMKGQRKVDLTSVDSELAHALAGEEVGDVRLGETRVTDGNKADRGFRPLQGTSRADFERAGLGWVAKGTTEAQRKQIVAKAKASVKRNRKRLAKQDSKVEEFIEKAETAYGGRTKVPRNVRRRIEAEARRQADEEFAAETDARAWLNRKRPPRARPASTADVVGPSQGVEGRPPADQVVEAARQAAIPTATGAPDLAGGAEAVASDPEVNETLQSTRQRLEDRGVVQGGFVNPESISPEAVELQQGMLDAGVAVVFVEDIPGGNAFRDRNTGVIFVSAAKMAEVETIMSTQGVDRATAVAVRNSHMNSVVAHEFTHTLQAQLPTHYQGLLTGLEEADPEAVIRGAESFLHAKATAEAKKNGTTLPPPLSPDQRLFTDEEVAEFVQANPDSIVEIVAYAVEYTAQRGTLQQQQQLAKVLAGGKRSAVVKFINKVGNMIRALKRTKSLSKAWSDMAKWEAMLDTFESAMTELKPDQQQETRQPEAERTGEAKALPPGRDGQLPDLNPDNELITPDREGGAKPVTRVQVRRVMRDAAEQVDGLQTMDDVRASLQLEADQRPQLPAPTDGTSEATIESPVETTPLAQQGEADPMRPEVVREAREQQVEHARRVQNRGRDALRRIKETKARIRKARNKDGTARQRGGNAQKALIQDHAVAAEAAIHLDATPPTKLEVIEQMIVDMIQDDPEGYEGIMPAMIQMAVEAGMSQAQAEQVAEEARRRQFIEPDEEVFGEEQARYASEIDDATSRYGTDQDFDSDEQYFDDIGGDFSLTSRTSPYLTDKQFNERKKKYGSMEQKIRSTGELQEDFDTMDRDMPQFDEIGEPIDPTVPEDPTDVEEQTLNNFGDYEEAFAFQTKGSVNSEDFAGLKVITMVGNSEVTVLAQDETFGNELFDIEGMMEIHFDLDGSHDMRMHGDRQMPRTIMSVVERSAAKLVKLGAFSKGVMTSSGGDTGRGKAYSRLLFTLASHLNNTPNPETGRFREGDERMMYLQLGDQHIVLTVGDAKSFLQDDFNVVRLASALGEQFEETVLDLTRNAGFVQPTQDQQFEITDRLKKHINDSVEAAIEAERPLLLPGKITKRKVKTPRGTFEVTDSETPPRQATPQERFDAALSKQNRLVEELQQDLLEIMQPDSRQAELLRRGREPAIGDRIAGIGTETNIPFRMTPPVPGKIAQDAYADVDVDMSLVGGRTLLGLLRSRGDLPPSVFNRKFRRDARMRAAQDQIDFRVGELKRAIKKQPKEEHANIMRQANTALSDPDRAKREAAMNALPAEVATQVQAMRHEIDMMTDQIINSGVVEGKLKVQLEKNKGWYVHRSYRVFDDPDWAKKVPKEVRNKMKRYLRSQGMTDEEADIKIQQLLMVGQDSDSPMAMLARGKGGILTDVLKGRKDIPKELAALWGEYDVADVNYTKSMQKMAALHSGFIFTKEVYAAGKGTLFFDKPSEENIAQFPDDKAKYGALAGKYTTPEFMNAWTAAHTPEVMVGPAASLYYRGLAAAKWGKTIGSPMTHVRNVVGNIGFAIANGHMSLRHSGAAIKDVIDSVPWIKGYFEGDRETAQKKYNELVKLGVVQGGNLQDIMDIIGAANESGLTVPEFLKKLQDGAAGNVIIGGKKGAEWLVKNLNSLYQFEDDAWKIYAYGVELRRYQAAYEAAGTTPTKFFTGATSLEEHVAFIIRDSYPNYNMPGRLVRMLRRSPFVGTFVSFPSEVIRTGYNRLKMTRAELADPATRSIGMARLIGQLSAYGLTIGFAQAVNAALGIEDEEVEAMREMVPPWAQNSPLIVMKDNDGKYSYIDLGYTDPHAMFFKPFMGLLRGETIQESLFGSSDGFHRGLLREAIEPFVGEDMVFGSLLDAYRGRDGNGVPLYSEGDPRMVKFQKIAEHLFDDLQPGFIKQLYTVPKNYLMGKTDKYGNVYDLPSHMLSVATGVKQQPINPEQAFSFHCRTFVRMERELRSELSRVAGRAGTVSEQEIATTYDRINAARMENLRSFRSIMLAAERLGMNDRRRAEIMHGAGMAKKRIGAMLQMKHIPIQIDTEFLDRNIRRAAAFNPDAPLANNEEIRKRLMALARQQQKANEMVR